MENARLSNRCWATSPMFQFNFVKTFPGTFFSAAYDMGLLDAHIMPMLSNRAHGQDPTRVTRLVSSPNSKIYSLIPRNRVCIVTITLQSANHNTSLPSRRMFSQPSTSVAINSYVVVKKRQFRFSSSVLSAYIKDWHQDCIYSVNFHLTNT